MKKTNLLTILIIFLMASCSSETKPSENQTESVKENAEISVIDDFDVGDFEIETDINFSFIKYLQLGITYDESKEYLDKHIDSSTLKKTQQGLEYNWEDEMGVEHNLSLGSYDDYILGFLTYRIDFPSEETKLLTWGYYADLQRNLLETYGEPTTMEESERSGKTIWDNEEVVVMLSNSDDNINLTIDYNFPSDSEFEKDEENGEWVQVGEDGRWVFVPNN